ncbi:3-dehydroquinate dehydratase-1 [Geomicrobium halophilum]|uniref:3-dehydroquinate dehydratase n=1 Tax=Geomicrobium halophilum TaxID=549000 RepID=A0A841Q085_9BACL|nr:type I 3-dehydroquinate dehydratase [Geomicrobium halophilum]MBB6450515.1 3-dehydroquinate dehydratase-1 [Geomicrobium halophilum]
MEGKEIKVRNTTLAGGTLSVCSAIVGKNEAQLLEEAEEIFPKKPDLVEWRADFFEQIDHTDAVLRAADRLRKKLGDIPLLFTIRSEKEGGKEIPLDEQEKVALLKKVCETESVDLIDFEVDNKQEDIQELQQKTQAQDVKLVLSFHNFKETPSENEMLSKLEKAKSYQADIGKLAVMPNDMSDVLSLLQITQTAEKNLDIPVITMSMGTDGALSRLIGWKFGSALTFAVGSKSSAPGQIPIEIVRQLEGYLSHEN